MLPLLLKSPIIITKPHKMFFKFIWNREEAVKRNTVIADYDKGGINMFHIKVFFRFIKIVMDQEIKQLRYCLLEKYLIVLCKYTGYWDECF